LGPRALQLAASAAAGVPPENVQRTGFNIEAFGLAPDGSAAYLGFRSPLTPASGRTNALLIPILNLPDLVRDSPSMGPARFGRPLELALDGRGFRSLDSSPNGMVIVAGTTTNTGSFLIYTWSGVAGEPPQERLVSFSVAKPEGPARRRRFCHRNSNPAHQRRRGRHPQRIRDARSHPSP
jgi:hypothetical protein